jgi:hypothetical protein
MPVPFLRFRTALPALVATLVACNSSSGPGSSPVIDAGADVTTPGNDGGEDATADGPEIDSSMPTVDSGTAVDSATTSVDSGTNPDSGAAALDSGTTVPDSGTTTPDSGTEPDASDSCSLLQGSFEASAVSCDGTPITFTDVTWIFTMNGSSASFSESIAGQCALVSSGTVNCANGVLTLVCSNPNTCNPANCTFWGTQCTATPNEWLGWTTSNVTATGFVSTTENEPDGGPTPLTTCTSEGKSNPVQVTWVKQ